MSRAPPVASSYRFRYADPNCYHDEPGAFMKLHIIMAACLLAGCANRPETIHASFVSHERYMDQNCMQLLGTLSNTRAELARFSRMQDGKATGDAWGVFLIGVPFSKLSGDHEGDVARLKGQVEALETAQVKQRCMSGGTMTVEVPVATTGSTPVAPQVTMQQPTFYTRQAPDQNAARGAVGADTPQAEQHARAHSCTPNPTAFLIAKGPGFETFGIACTSGDTIMVRCEFGNCRTLR